jgi:hypothetical protein
MKERGHLGDLAEDESILLKCILNRMWRCELDSSDSESGLMAGNCEYGNDLSRSVKVWEFFDQLSNFSF